VPARCEPVEVPLSDRPLPVREAVAVLPLWKMVEASSSDRRLLARAAALQPSSFAVTRSLSHQAIEALALPRAHLAMAAETEH
jgi:hypothetical protein